MYTPLKSLKVQINNKPTVCLYCILRTLKLAINTTQLLPSHTTLNPSPVSPSPSPKNNYPSPTRVHFHCDCAFGELFLTSVFCNTTVNFVRKCLGQYRPIHCDNDAVNFVSCNVVLRIFTVKCFLPWVAMRSTVTSQHFGPESYHDAIDSFSYYIFHFSCFGVLVYDSNGQITNQMLKSESILAQITNKIKLSQLKFQYSQVLIF